MNTTKLRTRPITNYDHVCSTIDNQHQLRKVHMFTLKSKIIQMRKHAAYKTMNVNKENIASRRGVLIGETRFRCHLHNARYGMVHRQHKNTRLRSVYLPRRLPILVDR